MEVDLSQTLIFSGSSHPLLAKGIAKELGIKLGEIKLSRFPDGELAVQIKESVRGKDVFVVQTIAIDPNNFLMELLIIIDALKRASAKSIVAVIPYFGYSRQDRKDKPRVAITAKLVANLLEKAGATRVLTMDLHAGQLQGFFDIPVDNLYGRGILLEALKQKRLRDCVVVAPDLGSIKLARLLALELGVDFAVIDKHRKSAEDVEVMSVIGDIKGKDILLADDMCSTGGTLASAAKACRERGANRIFVAVTHGVFVGDAAKKLESSDIETIFATDTVFSTDRLKGFSKLETVSSAKLFAKAIQCILSSRSISSLFENEKVEKLNLI